MSEHATPDERTEMPTERRMGKLREEGSLFVSNDMMLAASLLSAFLCLLVLWEGMFSNMKWVMVRSYRMIGELGTTADLSVTSLYRGFLFLLWNISLEIILLALVVATVASLSVFLQTRWNVKKKKIDIKFKKLNPISGIRQVFSIQGFINTLKALFKLCLILPIGYLGLKEYAPAMTMLVHTTVDNLLALTGVAIMDLFWKIFTVLLIFAIFDRFWGKYQWLRQNKMTKDEVKDERKAVEGDEETKREIKNRGLTRLMQQIMSSVPNADVVVTNPTHYSVALKYDRDTMRAPTILAKGKGFRALRIREVARDAGVPILQRKPLARALFHTGEEGKEIPYELYRAVAELFAYVYKLKNPHAAAMQTAPQG